MASLREEQAAQQGIKIFPKAVLSGKEPGAGENPLGPSVLSLPETRGAALWGGLQGGQETSSRMQALLGRGAVHWGLVSAWRSGQVRSGMGLQCGTASLHSPAGSCGSGRGAVG